MVLAVELGLTGVCDYETLQKGSFCSLSFIFVFLSPKIHSCETPA